MYDICDVGEIMIVWDISEIENLLVKVKLDSYSFPGIKYSTNYFLTRNH